MKNGTASDWEDAPSDQTLEDLNQILFSSLATRVINLLPEDVTYGHTVYPASDGIQLSYLMQHELGAKEIYPKVQAPEIEKNVYYLVSPWVYLLHGKPENFVLPVWIDFPFSRKISGFCPEIF